jgi:aryl-alcohol dehydrogenase-like predicted oxidoreductase
MNEKMECRKSGKSDLSLSVIGLGCWTFGGGDYWGKQDQKDVNEVVAAAVDYGINYFDTAEAYNEGRSESSLGLALQGISREKVLIGSKIAPANCYPGTLERHCEDSLRRLQTEYIDLYMIHWPIHPHSIKHFTKDDQVISNPPEIQKTFEILAELQSSGKIRNIGISNFSRNRIRNDLPSSVAVAANQLPYNLLCRAIEFETMPACAENGIGIIGYMTLLQGILSGKYAKLANVPEWQRRTRHFDSAGTALCRHGENGFEHDTETAINAIRTIASEIGMSMSELATRWAISNRHVTCALVGARNLDQLSQNVSAAKGSLDSLVIQKLNAVTEPLKQKMGNHFDYYESVANDRTV